MAAPRNAAPTPNIAPFIAVVAVLLAVTATALRLPGAIVLWALLILAGWMSTGPQLTGRKDANGYPTVGNPGEGARLRRHQVWQSFRWRLFGSVDWLPGDPAALRKILTSDTPVNLPIRGVPTAVLRALGVLGWALIPAELGTVAALGVAGIVVTLPVDALAIIGAAPETAAWLMWPNAIAAYAVARQVPASMRRFAAPHDPKPPVTFAHAITGGRDRGWSPVAVPAAGAVAFVAAGIVAAVVLLGFEMEWLFVPWAAAAAGCGAVASALTLRQIGLPSAWAPWQLTVAARQAWDVRWQSLKVEPAPFLVAATELTVDQGMRVSVDTFEAPATLGAEGIVNMLPKLTTAVGGGARVIVLNEPDTDSSGRPVPGSRSPVRASIVVWPTDATFDVTAPGMDGAVFDRLLHAAAATDIATETRLPQPVLVSTEPIADTEEGAPPAWVTRWAVQMDPATTLGFVASRISALLGVEAIADPANSSIFVGPELTGGSTSFHTPDIEVRLIQLARESAWASRWYNVLKQGEQKPYIQHAVYGEWTLPTGQRVFTQPFMTAQGFPSEQYMTDAKEKALSSTLENAPFVSVQRWDGASERAGERHQGAFRAVWSPDRVNFNPAKVAPFTPALRQPTTWVLAAGVMAGFDAAKLPRPELVDATPLTSRASDEHIWNLHLRLFGAVTLAVVKQNIEKIRNGMGAVEWIRVTQAPDGCRIVAGARPAKVKWARADNAKLCAALDWEQAFTDAKVITSSGQVPTLESVTALPKNGKVQRLVFKMPPGLDRGAVRNAKKVLMPATGNTYLEDEAGPTPSTVTLLACPVEPVPYPAPYDWDDVADSAAVPFAAGVTGEPIEWNWKQDPHLLVLGGTGSGKSAALTNLIAGSLIQHADIYLADPTKGAADFRFAAPWMKAIAITDGEASAMMDHVYAEVLRRKDLNAAHGVASYTDLPADIRPRHVVVLIDEFTSLMFTEKVERLSDTATEQDKRVVAEQELSNSNRRNIGSKAGRLVREARSAGVSLILAGQELKADTLERIPGGSSLKGNSSRLLLGKTNYGSRMSALKEPESAPDLGDSVPLGRGLYETTASRAQVMQAWFDGTAESGMGGHVESLTTHIAAVRSVLSDDERVDLSTRVRVVEEGPSFGQRLDSDPDFAADEDEVLDLGIQDIDFGGLFDDDDDDDPVDTAPAALLGTASPAHTALLAGPGVEDAPTGAIDVDELDLAPLEVTGVPAVDVVIAWVLANVGVERIEWLSPAAAQHASLLAEHVAMFGVTEVVPVTPDDGSGDPEPAPEMAPAETLPSAPAAPTPATPAPEPASAEPEPVAPPMPRVTLPPPPPEDDLFGTPRRVLTADDMF